MKIATRFAVAAILLSAMAALPPAGAQSSASATAHSAQPMPAGQAQGRKEPHAKTKPEFDAYQAASGMTDPAKLQAAATDFAQKYPASELRPYLFQRAMGLYQQANNPEKTLEMARAVLKYDPANAVALLAAAQILADTTHDDNLDRAARFEEATSDTRSALQHIGETARPTQLTAEEFAGVMAQLRGMAHEVLGTVAYKRRDYINAIREYNAAAAEEKQHTDAVVWLRLAVAHDKCGDYEAGIAAAMNAIAGSPAGSQVCELAEKEKARAEKLKASELAPGQSGDAGGASE